MSQRRKRPAQSKKPKQPRPSPAAFQRPTRQAAGAPIQAARPPVTGLMSYMVEPVFLSDRPQPPLGTLAPKGSPGRYRVNYPLAIPGRYVVQNHSDFTELITSGDSLLEVGPQVHTIQVSVIDPGDATADPTAKKAPHPSEMPPKALVDQNVGARRRWAHLAIQERLRRAGCRLVGRPTERRDRLRPPRGHRRAHPLAHGLGKSGLWSGQDEDPTSYSYSATSPSGSVISVMGPP